MRIQFIKSAGPIKSILHLCEILDIKQEELKEALAIPSSKRYSTDYVPKSDGSLRKINNPDYRIRKIQKRINRRLFNPKKSQSQQSIVQWPSYVFGCIPNQLELNDSNEFEIESRDYIACAQVHCLSKSFLKLDISDFFDNVDSEIVEGIFRDLFEYDEEVVQVLTNICCNENTLVQGALTSSYLACLALWDVEPELVRRLSKKKLKYTRLIDDITISTFKQNYDFSFVKDLVIGVLHSKDLPVNINKTETLYVGSSPILIHGLRVNFKEPRLPSNEVSRIRASVQNVEKLAKERHYRTIHPYRRDFNRCLGRVNKLARVGHKEHINLLKRLSKIIPLPSKRDISRCEKMIIKLEKDYLKGKSITYWYWRRYNRASQRIAILQRTFTHSASSFRERLRIISSSYLE